MNKKDIALIKAFINRDGQGSSYHFALVRALAEIAAEFNHLARRRNNNELTLPLGLLVWKWMLYYFPIVEQGLPQVTDAGSGINRNSQLHFQAGLKKITDYYSGHGGFETFYQDLVRGGISTSISRDLIIVLRQIRDTIEETLRQSGTVSTLKRYTLLSYNKDTRHIMEVTRPVRINPEFLVQNFGTFNIRRNFYETLRMFADFMTGTGSVINHWALFSAEAGGADGVAVNHALSVLATPPQKRNDILQAHKLYRDIAEHGVELRCIWSGRTLDASNLVLDHIIPFSLISNNDLWNLMPCHHAVNVRKGDCIPSPALLNTRAGVLQNYWAVARDFYPSLFDRQFKISLVGFEINNYEIKWADAGLSALKDRCRHCIDQKGIPGWNG